MKILTWFRGSKQIARPKRRRKTPAFESLEDRAFMTVGLGYVGLASAPPAEMSYLAGQIRQETTEVEVSFLPFEFNPSKPFENATQLAHETLTAGFKGRLRLTVDLEWFVHSSGKNGKLDNGTGASAFVYGRQASDAFWAAWAADKPTIAQQQIRSAFLARVHTTDIWIGELRAWAAQKGVQSKLGVTLVPVLEDECSNKTAYSNLVNAIKSQQATDAISPTLLRRSMNGDRATSFRVSGVSMELHGKWSDVKDNLQSGDTWSNDGTVYGINEFVADGKAAKKAGVSALYWNSDMNGASKTDTNWASRTVNFVSGLPAKTNKLRLDLVLEIS